MGCDMNLKKKGVDAGGSIISSLTDRHYNGMGWETEGAIRSNWSKKLEQNGKGKIAFLFRASSSYHL